MKPVGTRPDPGGARRRRLGARVATPLRFAAGAVLALLLTSCRWGAARERTDAARELTGGEPSRGPALMRQYGCAACHTIPGVTGANGTVGPPLGGIANRSYLGGVLTNGPQNMIRWIRDPKSVDSLTVMPNTGLGEAEARDIAAYLYTLR